MTKADFCWKMKLDAKALHPVMTLLYSRFARHTLELIKYLFQSVAAN
jgi:hypothetical protein